MRPEHVLLMSAACLAILLFIPACSALYDFEGIPLNLSAEGAVQGEVLTFGSYGLTNPPVTCTFNLDKAPAFARVYAGVWGGTEQYRGWAEIQVNGASPTRYVLYGKDDKNEGVYASGHGVYWIAQDATGLLNQGQNTITVKTSRGEADNKLDGRVYAVFAVVATDKEGAGPVTRYQLAEGNVNLHGEGWSGTNPTQNDATSLSMASMDITGVTQANLTIFLVASSRGQPDYILLNGKDLGQPATPKEDYPGGARDIGNERSFDATGGAGVESRYVDAETFDVTGLVNALNTVRFERGRDLNGDGTITETGEKPEGEDYIHPVLALLTVKSSAAPREPDYSVTDIQVKNAYTGKEATITATVWNSGFGTKSPADVIFKVDGVTVKTVPVVMDPSGRTVVSAPWTSTEGAHTVGVSVSGGDDTDTKNTLITREIHVGTPPALGVTIGTPYRAGSAAAVATQKAPLSPFVVIAGLAALLYMVKRRGPGVGACILLVLLCSAAVVVPVAAANLVSYTVPLTVTNTGGSDSPSFDITIYVDGQKAAVSPVTDGIPAHSSKVVLVNLYVTPGSHTLKVAVDEAGKVSGGSPGGVAQGVYDFP
jgi:subtilase family serine protease